MLLEVAVAAAMSSAATPSPPHGGNLKQSINWRIAMIMRVRQLAVNSAVRNAHFISTMQACDKEEVSQSTASLPLSGVSLLCENPAHFDIGVTFGRLSTWLYNRTSACVTHAPHRL